MVIRLDTSHTKALADVLCRAFYAEPLFTYMVPDEKARRALLPWFLSAAIRASHFCGENYTTPDLAGGALWIRPSCTFSIRRIVQRRLQSVPFKLGTGSWRRWLRLGARLEEVRQGIAKTPHWYLLALGVEPSKRQEAICEALIRPVLSRADCEGIPCYLETFQERHLSFYEAQGFRIEGGGRIAESGPEFWAMMRRQSL
jgi:hypothetical protein